MNAKLVDLLSKILYVYHLINTQKSMISKIVVEIIRFSRDGIDNTSKNIIFWRWSCCSLLCSLAVFVFGNRLHAKTTTGRNIEWSLSLNAWPIESPVARPYSYLHSPLKAHTRSQIQQLDRSKVQIHVTF